MAETTPDTKDDAPIGDLAQFIEETLVQIVQGIVGAQLRVDELSAQINPVGALQYHKEKHVTKVSDNRFAYVEMVEFDVAITRSENDASGVSGGIRVLGVDVGGKREGAESMTRVSRLKFSVPVVFPGDPNLGAEAEAKDRAEKEANLRRSQRTRRNWATDF